MTDIYESRLEKYGNSGPVYPFDDKAQAISDTVTGSWYLESTLYVSESSYLIVQGTGLGGDCDHLLLASNAEKFINLRAHGGSIWIEGTHVESWDITNGAVDEDDTDGRRCAYSPRCPLLFNYIFKRLPLYFLRDFFHCST